MVEPACTPEVIILGRSDGSGLGLCNHQLQYLSTGAADRYARAAAADGYTGTADRYAGAADRHADAGSANRHADARAANRNARAANRDTRPRTAGNDSQRLEPGRQ